MGQYTDVLAELVDLYPTIAELAGLPHPRTAGEAINGTSLASIFDASRECDHGRRREFDSGAGAHTRCRPGYMATGVALKTAAWSQYAKPCQNYAAQCQLNTTTCVGDQFHRNQTKIMGYTIRTDDWRYTVIRSHLYAWTTFRHL